jgi:hypothetical protein
LARHVPLVGFRVQALSLKRVDRFRNRPEPQGRLSQRDEVFEREAGDPPLPVTG